MCAIASAMIALNPGPGLIVVALGCLTFFGTFSLPLAPGALQEIMPNAMRGQATAVYVAFTNLIGGGLAATTVALLTDFVFHDKAKLHLSFGLVGCIVCVLAALTLTWTLRAFRITYSQHKAMQNSPEAPRRTGLQAEPIWQRGRYRRSQGPLGRWPLTSAPASASRRRNSALAAMEVRPITRKAT
jgi:MFS family permease